MIPVTYFPVATQHQFAKNRELIRGKPYEHYFDGDLWLHDEVLPALRKPMDPADAIRPDPVRSRYWIGHDITLRAFGRSVPLGGVAAGLGIRRRLGGERAAFEQLHHDLIEFTHLSTFLAAIFREFA